MRGEAVLKSGFLQTFQFDRGQVHIFDTIWIHCVSTRLAAIPQANAQHDLVFPGSAMPFRWKRMEIAVRRSLEKWGPIAEIEWLREQLARQAQGQGRAYVPRKGGPTRPPCRPGARVTFTTGC